VTTVDPVPTRSPGFTLGDLAGSPRRNRTERLLKATVAGAAFTSIAISIAIVAVLVVKGFGFIAEVDLSSLLDPSGWFPRSGRFDLVTIIAGSLWVTLIALIFATPVGIGAALYLSEYASPRARRTLKPIVEVLAGLPSVVVAYFVLQVIFPSVLQHVFGWINPDEPAGKYTLLGAGLGVGVLSIPIIATVTEDALASVPRALREASHGLGATKMTTTLRVVLPAALSGITAALIIGASRALGETMLVTLAAGGSGGAARTLTPAESGLTMTSAMANLAAGTDNVATSGGIGFNPVDSLYFVGLLLFVFTLGLNLLGNRIVRKYRQAY
jgi:phosphate transport system permease protein